MAQAAAAFVESEEEMLWLCRVREALEQASAEELGAAPRVFDVPRALRDTKPEAYAPHHFALGPYHHGRPELRGMERYKLAAAKRTEQLFADDRRIRHLVDRFLGDLRFEMRGLYHRVLDLSDETLAWLMAIDTCFLLDFLEGYYHRTEATDMMSSAASWINATVRDAMMIENQLPLRLFAEAIELRRATEQDTARTRLYDVFERFIKHVSPIKMRADVAVAGFTEEAHMLELLYHFLVPPDAVFDDDKRSGGNDPGPEGEEQPHDADPGVEPQVRDVNKVKKAFSRVFDRLNVGSLVSRAMSAVSKLYGKMTSRLPVLPGMVSVVRKMAESVDVERVLKSMNMEGVASPPLTNEIKIPSVAQLANCGVRFVPTPEGIYGIAFDRATATLHLPVITLDDNTEVVLRNLVVYEAVAVRGPLVLSRYTEMMNGIIDTKKDVKILLQSGVLVNRMKSNREAADMWNGMCRATTRVSKVSRLDGVIQAVNAHRARTASVRVQKMIKRYVFQSWKILTLLASVVLLLMTALEAFCSAYPCHDSWFGKMLQLTTPEP